MSLWQDDTKIGCWWYIDSIMNAPLKSLTITASNWSGATPSVLCSMNSLTSLDLSRNEITSFSSCLYKLGRLDLSENRITALPSDTTCGSDNLENLNLANNLIAGSFPNCTFNQYMRSLNISHNQFIGIFPFDAFHEKDHLVTVDMSRCETKSSFLLSEI